ncbi:MAG: pyrrolysine--tRNA(Pyl) ligase large subunit [Dethiobacter sp.]|nr:MAG: pyrrolysine--tRNA(Pyl) ligase large subunit [Dethiobacter sp.]
MKFTHVQIQRLIELGLNTGLEYEFANSIEREANFKQLEKELVKQNKAALKRLHEEKRPLLKTVEQKLIGVLTENGFIEVITPILMSRGLLEKMGLTPELFRQVFWVDEGKKRCLRPMLAPHLYYLLRKMKKIWPAPLKIFEVGPCFRKESKGGYHMEEFTMLNLVCFSCTEPLAELLDLADKLLDPFNIPFNITDEYSEVYGRTIDIVVNDVEIASAAVGPHELDKNWDITGSWYGIGLGLERLAMVLQGYQNIRRVSRSLSYQDGARLNI